MVQLAFSTNAYTRTDLPDAVRRIASHEYDGVELLADTPHAFLPEFDESDQKELEDALNETGIEVSNINANTTPGYYDDARSDDHHRERRGARVASRLHETRDRPRIGSGCSVRLHRDRTSVTGKSTRTSA